MQAPCYRLDNLAAFVETHGERLGHLLEALISYRRRARKFRLKSFAWGFAGSLAAGAALFLVSMVIPALNGLDIIMRGMVALGAALVGLVFWFVALRGYFYKRFHKKTLKQLDHLTALNNQTRRDSWESVRNLVYTFLSGNRGKYSLRDLRNDYSRVWKVHEKGSKEIREALKELDELSPDEEAAFFEERLGITEEEFRNPPKSSVL
ncbi:MAG: hypothetical protein P8X55_13685 [Desulfosarcinaceae bacterium]